MRVLAIETSCDETGVALVEGALKEGVFAFEVLGSALLSQAPLHAPYGGVYPNLAKREHEKNLPIILEQMIRSVENSPEKSPRVSSLADNLPVGEARPDYFSFEFSTLNLDAIAVTHGPGLEPALWAGITFAQKLSKESSLSLMGINHMEGHLISSLAQNAQAHREIKDVQFPVLGLLISGGHTEFVLMRDWFNYEIIGRTLDDAVGEAFDKVARMLELPYPGGPEISKLADKAREGRKSSISPLQVTTGTLQNTTFSTVPKLPRPMLQSNTCDMSFSGLKTAALYALRDLGGIEKLSPDQRAAFAEEFEDTVGEVFVAKTQKALIETEAKTFIIGGGVAANRYLRERLQGLLLDEFPDVEFRLPDLSITGDNAVMIAEAALVHLLVNGLPTVSSEDIRAEGNLSLNTKK